MLDKASLTNLCSSSNYSCGYGNGYISLTDEKFNNEVWRVTEYKQFLQGSFTIENSGRITFNGESDDYKNSWEASAIPMNYPQNNDQSWPGPKPEDAGSLNINIKFDRFPAEFSYALKRMHTNGRTWLHVDAFNGANQAVHNELLSIQLDNLDEGWHQLIFKDSGNDGICCQYRYGWMAVTGFLKATRKSGLVWGNNGEFGTEVAVYLEVDSNGLFTQISDTSPI